jgi:hypothetical protein
MVVIIMVIQLDCGVIIVNDLGGSAGIVVGSRGVLLGAI